MSDHDHQDNREGSENEGSENDPATEIDVATESDAEREQRLRELTDNGETISAEDYRIRSRRSFLGFGALGLAGFFGFRHIQGRPETDNVPDVLRSGLELNEQLWETVQRSGADARTFDLSDRQDLRVNGRIGLDDPLEAGAAADWAIGVVGANGSERFPITLDDIMSLEVRDMVWEHKCIEGWSNIVHWTGVRFSDVLAAFAPNETDWKYTSLRTPDDRYYVGIDRFTMLHDQTMLAWQLNGEALTDGHGAPLRLVTPLKYGIKQLKRVATIEFSNDKPADYWSERGYDYHSGF